MAQLHYDHVVVQNARKISRLFVIIVLIMIMIIMMVIGMVIGMIIVNHSEVYYKYTL